MLLCGKLNIFFETLQNLEAVIANPRSFAAKYFLIILEGRRNICVSDIWLRCQLGVRFHSVDSWHMFDVPLHRRVVKQPQSRKKPEFGEFN